MAKKFEITVTQINEDGTRQAFETGHPAIGEGFVIMALTEGEKNGHKGVRTGLTIHGVSLMMLASALNGNKILNKAAHLASLGSCADALLGCVGDLRKEDGEDEEDEDAAD